MMSSCSAPETRRDITVGMGQIASGRGPSRLVTVLGSCVGVAVYHPRLAVGAVAHVVLPDSSGRTGPPGKFADTAVPRMVELLAGMGVPRSGLVAKISGGARMFAASGPMHVGQSNVEAVIRTLSAAGIRIIGEDVGGTSGRRLTFECSSGDLLIEIVGQSPRTL